MKARFLFFALLAALTLAAGAAPAPVTKGLTFALSFDGSGRAVNLGPYRLKVPGTRGFVKVSFDSAALTGGMLDAPIRVKNDSGADLLAVRVDLASVTESVRPAETTGAPAFTRPQNVAPPPPLAWDRIASGAETPADLFRGGPLTFSSETEVVVVLGVVSGLAAEAADPKRDVLTPATKTSACPGQPRGCRIDADRNVWRLEPAAEGRPGGLSERGPDGGVVRSLRFEGGAKPVDLALAPDGRLLVFLDDGSRDGAVRAFRPF
ncbi:MAG: hypothetical protein NEA02_10075 [Thermoanaerobaculia bacterium]|nr:hypothetical protein [Thermoanaerobaculia bacterium]